MTRQNITPPTGAKVVLSWIPEGDNTIAQISKDKPYPRYVIKLSSEGNFILEEEEGETQGLKLSENETMQLAKAAAVEHASIEQWKSERDVDSIYEEIWKLDNLNDYWYICADHPDIDTQSGFHGLFSDYFKGKHPYSYMVYIKLEDDQLLDYIIGLHLNGYVNITLLSDEPPRY